MEKKYIIILICISLGLRLVFFGVFKPWQPEIEKQKVIVQDAVGYHSLAVSLLEHGRYGSDEEPGLAAIRTPLYPMFVAAVYKVFGWRPWMVLLIQVLLDTLTCLLLFSKIR